MTEEVGDMPDELFTRYYVDVRRSDAPARLRARLAADGLACFDGIADREQFHTLAAGLTTVTAHRDSDPEGVTTVTRTLAGDDPVRPGFSAFTSL